MASLVFGSTPHLGHKLWLKVDYPYPPVTAGTVHVDVWCATCARTLPEDEYDLEVARAPGD